MSESSPTNFGIKKTSLKCLNKADKIINNKYINRGMTEAQVKKKKRREKEKNKVEEIQEENRKSPTS